MVCTLLSTPPDPDVGNLNTILSAGVPVLNLKVGCPLSFGAGPVLDGDGNGLGVGGGSIAIPKELDDWNVKPPDAQVDFPSLKVVTVEVTKVEFAPLLSSSESYAQMQWSSSISIRSNKYYRGGNQ